MSNLGILLLILAIYSVGVTAVFLPIIRDARKNGWPTQDDLC